MVLIKISDELCILICQNDGYGMLKKSGQESDKIMFLLLPPEKYIKWHYFNTCQKTLRLMT